MICSYMIYVYIWLISNEKNKSSMTTFILLNILLLFKCSLHNVFRRKRGLFYWLLIKWKDINLRSTLKLSSILMLRFMTNLQATISTDKNKRLHLHLILLSKFEAFNEHLSKIPMMTLLYLFVGWSVIIYLIIYKSRVAS